MILKYSDNKKYSVAKFGKPRNKNAAKYNFRKKNGNKFLWQKEIEYKKNYSVDVGLETKDIDNKVFPAKVIFLMKLGDILFWIAW